MECKKNHNYSKIDIGFDNNGNGLNVSSLAKQGNQSIQGLMHKCVAVKRRGCK